MKKISNKQQQNIAVDIKVRGDLVGDFFHAPFLIHTKDLSRANLLLYFVWVANEVADRLKLEKPENKVPDILKI